MKNCSPQCQTYKPAIILNQISKKWPNSQKTWLIHGIKHHTAGTISCEAWNSPVDYPNTESKHVIKEFEWNIFNQIFIEKVQGQHPWILDKWQHMTNIDLGQHWLSSGLLPDDTKTLTESMLAEKQWGILAPTWWQLYNKCSKMSMPNLVRKYLISY